MGDSSCSRMVVTLGRFGTRPPVDGWTWGLRRHRVGDRGRRGRGPRVRAAPTHPHTHAARGLGLCCHGVAVEVAWWGATPRMGALQRAGARVPAEWQLPAHCAHPLLPVAPSRALSAGRCSLRPARHPSWQQPTARLMVLLVVVVEVVRRLLPTHTHAPRAAHARSGPPHPSDAAAAAALVQVHCRGDGQEGPVMDHQRAIFGNESVMMVQWPPCVPWA